MAGDFYHEDDMVIAPDGTAIAQITGLAPEGTADTLVHALNRIPGAEALLIEAASVIRENVPPDNIDGAGGRLNTVADKIEEWMCS